MKTVFDRIIETLDRHGVGYKVSEHEPVFTSADAAKVQDTDPSSCAKALVFLADKNPVLVVLPGNKKVDTGTFKRTFGVKDLVLAPKETVKELTTLDVGSIPPTGSVLGLKTYFDNSFKSKEEIVFNAGFLTKSVHMKAEDLINIEKPEFADYTL